MSRVASRAGSYAHLDKEKAPGAVNSEGPQNKIVHALSLYSAPVGASSAAGDHKPEIRRLTRREITDRQRAIFRRAELFRLIAWRRDNGVVAVDDDTYVWALAVTLAVGTHGPVPIPRRQRAFRWPGLDLISLSQAVGNAGLRPFSEDELVTVIRAIDVWSGDQGAPLISDAKMGHLLQLAPDERRECGIRTIDAVGESRADRIARGRARKRENDKRRVRTKRVGKHRPRHVYCATAAERRRLCEQLGISDRTLRRWQRQGRCDVRSVSHHPINKGHATHFGHALADPAKQHCGQSNPLAVGPSAGATPNPTQDNHTTTPGLPGGRGHEVARLLPIEGRQP